MAVSLEPVVMVSDALKEMLNKAIAREGDFPSQTTFIYDREPFGSSLDLETRAKQ